MSTKEAVMNRTAKDVMTKTVVVLHEAAPYKEIVRLLHEYRVNALPVVDGAGILLGMVSEADLLLKEEFTGERPHHVLHRGRHRTERTKARGLVARDVMTTPVVTARPDDSLSKVARLLHEHRVKQVPVTSPEGHVVGIISRGDVLRVFLRTDGEIRDEIQREVIVRTLWLEPSTVGVAVSEGVVTLEGQVENHSLVDWMVTLVEKVDGVVGVENRLTYQIDDRAIPSSALIPYWNVYAPGMGPRRASPEAPVPSERPS